MYFKRHRRPTRPAPAKKTHREQAELAYRHTSFTKAFGRQRSFIGRSARVNYVNSRFGDCRQIVPRLGNAGSQ